MNLLRNRIPLFTMAVISVASVVTSADERMKYDLNGYGHWQIGQVVHGRGGAYPIKNQWMNSSILGVSVHGYPSERLEITASPEFKLFFPFPEEPNIGTRRSQSVAYINEMNGNYVLGDVEKPWAEIRVGTFNYKYNPESKDFGEYLFRTGTYPPFMINNFDYAKARLTGLNVQYKPIEGLKFDAILNTELQYYPLYDFSLSFLAQYKFLKAFDFGTGVSFARLFPIKDNKTNPTENTPGISGPNGRAIVYKKPNGDSAYYSFQSTKLMLRGSFDPKAFLPDFTFFGESDLKLYFEVALTGFPIKSVPDSAHPDLYGSISRLMPMVAGFNIPAFKLLDVFSVEVEYFPTRMPNDYEKTVLSAVPLPARVPILPPFKSDYNPSIYKQRDIGWAFYASKEVFKGFSLVGLVAYDHMRMPFVDGSESTGEAMANKGDWAWQAKTKFAF